MLNPSQKTDEQGNTSPPVPLRTSHHHSKTLSCDSCCCFCHQGERTRRGTCFLKGFPSTQPPTEAIEKAGNREMRIYTVSLQLLAPKAALGAIFGFLEIFQNLEHNRCSKHICRMKKTSKNACKGWPGPCSLLPEGVGKKHLAKQSTQ